MATLKHKATDESLAQDETRKGLANANTNYDTIPKNRRPPCNPNRQQDKRRADKKARRHVLQNYSTRK